MATVKNSSAARVCPMCGGINAPDAVFCANPQCHKALGEFAYVREELRRDARWHETLADRVVGFIGRPQFLGIHLLWFAAWILLNTGVLMVVRRFDTYPFGLLAIILSMETIFITGFVLISENRQSAHADKRAELDYEVNVRTYRKIEEVETLLRAMTARLDASGRAEHGSGRRRAGGRLIGALPGGLHGGALLRGQRRVGRLLRDAAQAVPQDAQHGDGIGAARALGDVPLGVPALEAVQGAVEPPGHQRLHVRAGLEVVRVMLKHQFILP